MDNTGMVELRANTRLREHLYEQAVTKSEFCDVTLEFGPPNKMKQMGAHWCVLVHCPYFEYMYRFFGNKQDTVRVYDEQIEAIDTAIKFLYTGKASFEIDTVEDVLSIGQFFQMSELLDSCASYLANLRRCEHNCIKIFFIARHFKLPMYEDIVTYIITNLISVIEYSPNGRKITGTVIKELIGHKSACTIRPFVLRNFCRKWRNYDEHNRHREYLDLMALLTNLTTLSCVSNTVITDVKTLEVLMVITNKPRSIYAYVVEEDRWKFVTKLPSALSQSSFWRDETTLLAVDPNGESVFALKNDYTKSYATNNISVRIHKYDLNSESWSEHNPSFVFNDSNIIQMQVNRVMCLNGKLHLVITTLNVISKPKRIMLLTWKEETGTFTKSFLFRFNPRSTVLEDVNSCILNNNDICVVCSVKRYSEREIKLVVQDVKSKEVKLLRPVSKEVYDGKACKLLTFPNNDDVCIATLDSPWYTIVNVNTGTLVHNNDWLFKEPKQALSKQMGRFISGNFEKSVFVLDSESNRGFQFYYGSKTWYRIPTLEYKVGSGAIVQATLPSTMLHKLSDTLKCECKLLELL
ncbi:hypothetical protein DPMN_074304 [Dreissena polymorpha]|uniref:BTB domain-containing protein n=2 Tax=Dreissena polymorpha TaxID=45954 RepID=A0A9D4BLG1_DREPO|nr:hypothetical protein DPMN_074304 [Dreissena polymorpha]